MHRPRQHTRLGAGVAAVLTAAATALLAPAATVPASADVGHDPYEFDNVVVGGGGYVPGLVFNPSEPDLIYVRTDIGGVYRWEPDTESWTPLFDHLGWDEWSRDGGVSVATDPVDPDRVYVAGGMYTNGWDPFNGVIFRSEDRGDTWESTELPFPLSGNMPGRGMGERLRVDPNDNSVLYFGAPDGNGLWRSTDYGETWNEVTSFPNAGHWAIDPGTEEFDGYEAMEIGIPWVTFDPRTTTADGRSDTIYVGVADADLQNPVYVSHDAGETWEPLDGAPTGWLPHRGVLDETTGELFLPMANDPGPYGGDDGAVWRYDTDDAQWTDVSPPHFFEGDDRYYGFTGLSVDHSTPGTLVVSAQISWWPDNMLWRSTDSGATWEPIWEISWWPEETRTNRYDIDISDYPWLDMGVESEFPEESPKLGWMMSLLEIDPHDPDRMFYGTGATIYGTTNLTDWDSGADLVHFAPEVEGFEETAIIDLVSPPEGARLLSGMGDIGGFTHFDLDSVSPYNYNSPPSHVTVRGIDFAENNPNMVVRVGDIHGDRVPEGDPDPSRIAFSTDGGRNWWAPQPSQLPAGLENGSGSVAIAADAGSVVWSPNGTGPHRSTDSGSSWTPVSGLDEGAMVRSDRVDSDTFYAFQDGDFLVSTDGGASFTATDATGLPDGSASWGIEGADSTTLRFTTVPGAEGDVWLVAGPPTTGIYDPEVEDAGGYGVWRSTDGGQSFTKLDNARAAHNVAFGRAHPDGDYHAVYIVGEVDGVRGLFRSDDEADSWVRINDDQHQYGNMGQALAADPNTYGRVYLGTDGRGIIYGDPVDPPEGGNGGDNGGDNGNGDTPTEGCDYAVVGSWPGGFQAELSVTNTGSTTTRSWRAEWAFPGGQRVTQMWGGEYQQQGATVSVTNASYNGTLAPGQTATAGFLGSGDGAGSVPTGLSCALE